MRAQTDAAVRFWAKVDKSGDCWEWLAATSRGGYGLFKANRETTTAYAHRIAYELMVGTIPEGLTIDHLCRNRRCVNPAHLEAVTRGVNTRRAYDARGPMTECSKGHAIEGYNALPRSDGRVRCRQCQRKTATEWQRRKTAASRTS
jgi:hypothetical protein